MANPPRSWHPAPGDKRRVVVVGAGIAGLTAAHELVERGFEVEVVEAQSELERDKDGDLLRKAVIGGMARTSWAAIPVPPDQFPLEPDRSTRPFTPIKPDTAPPPLTVPKEQVYSDPTNPRPVFGHRVNVFFDSVDKIDSVDQNDKPLRVALLIIGPFDQGDRPALEAALEARRPGRWSLSHADPNLTITDPNTAPPVWYQFAVESTRVPGEHGFRFFPSFYRNMFDTMKRIPIEEASISATPQANETGVTTMSDSARTAFDALESADQIGFGLRPHRGRERERSFEISRRPIRSFQQLRELIQDVLERAGYRGQDIYRLATRYLEYLTSSQERRRAEYEELAWADFLGLGANYSAYFASHVNGGAQGLAAMSSQTNDARTIGSIAVQLTLDELRVNESGYTDATLRGPTSEALFGPWQTYLQTQGVVFRCARFAGFCGRGMAVRPVFVTDNDSTVDIDPADYYVLAIPIHKLQELFAGNGDPTVRPAPDPGMLNHDQLFDANDRWLELDELEAMGSPDTALTEIPRAERNDLRKHLTYRMNDYAVHPDEGPLRYMCGVQFYFDADVRLFLGHTLCLDSLWGVSYISQEQYWQDRSRGQDGVRGVLSAIFTRFEVAAPGITDPTPKTAMQCNEAELVERVWKQIADTWNTPANGPSPTPHYYFLDENLSRPHEQWRNETPYLVNKVCDWEHRGGARTASGDYVYPMQLGHTVFAGTFMRTTTRLNSMEAANETGRRAVNAILDREGVLAERVPVYDLEHYEVPELRPLRELDARIWRRGGKHVLRSTVAEAALRAIPWDLVRLGLPTRGERR
jgi:FAD dependent oxidoreductase